jgi:putative NADH-flavin reductase
MVGSRILAELVRRGHQVTAVVRNPAKIIAAGVRVLKGDVTDAASVAQTAKGADAAISAYAPPKGEEPTLSAATYALLEGLQAAGVSRLIVVGGAGSLKVGGVQLVDAPGFPEAYRDIAMAHRDLLPILEESTLDWTCLSPAAIIEPGERTGKFRLGTTDLVADEKGQSRISAEDYAFALADELENPRHIRQQFTLAY